MNPVFHLYQLQKIDSQMMTHSNRLHTIEEMMRNDTTVKQAKLEVERVSNDFNLLNVDSNALAERILTRRNKLEQSESSLYSGTIKNPKELQDLQREISFIKSNISDIEDDQLDLMIRIDSTQEMLNASLANLHASTREFETKNQSLINEKQNLERENSRLAEERSMIISQINPSLLASYDSLRNKKKGIAVSRVEDQTCSVCGATLTPAECQAAKSNTGNNFCPSCGRILYAD